MWEWASLSSLRHFFVIWIQLNINLKFNYLNNIMTLISKSIIDIIRSTNMEDNDLEELKFFINNYKLTTHKYLKGKIIFNFKKDIIMKDKDFHKLVIRIDKDFITEYKNFANLPDSFIFSYDKKQETETTFLWDKINYPEYTANENDIYATNPKIEYNFYTIEEYNSFLDNIKIKPVKNTLWYPNRPNIKTNQTDVFYTTKNYVKNTYPIYIVSYKRYDTMLTIKAMEELNILNYYVVIRCTEDEPDNYRKSMKKLNIQNIDDKLLIMSTEFMDNESKSGNNNSIIPRRYAWNHAMNILKTSHHWVLDDNIDGFYIRNKGQHTRIKNTALPFQFIEKYIEQYPNVYQAGMQYKHLCIAGGHRNVIIKNSRIYSCILNRHSVLDHIKDNWQGSYNEDTDLSLRILKCGLATMNFQNFLCDKKATSSMKGGNNVSAYIGNGFENKVNELIEKHGDVTKKVFKYNRIHHQVDYTQFNKNDISYIDKKLVFEKLIAVDKIHLI